MSVTIAKDETHFETLINDIEKEFVLVDFYADWCGPCKSIAKHFDKFCNEYKNLDIVKVNIEECEEIAEKFNVSKLPTFFFCKKGSTTPIKGPIIGGDPIKLEGFIKSVCCGVKKSDDF